MDAVTLALLEAKHSPEISTDEPACPILLTLKA